jgi:cell division protein FtsB
MKTSTKNVGMTMPKENEQNKERSKITVRIGDVQVELEGTQDNIKKLMNQELFDFAKGLEATAKQQPPPSSTETAPKTTPKTPEVAPKEKTASLPPSKPPTTSGTPSQPSRVPTVAKKPEKMGKRKISWKPAAIALVLVCIVVSAGLVGVLAIYLPMVDDLNSQIAQQNSDISTFTMQIGSLSAQVASLQKSLDQSNSTIKNLQDGVETLNLQIQSYLNVIYMNASGYLFSQTPISAQNASTYSIVFQDTLEYAGYVAISVQSTSDTTYVQTVYSSFKVNYNQNVTVGKGGTAYFPVLPGDVEIRVGNTDTGDLMNATATGIYYF